jgi:hypothetical protein
MGPPMCFFLQEENLGKVVFFFLNCSLVHTMSTFNYLNHTLFIIELTQFVYLNELT